MSSKAVPVWHQQVYASATLTGNGNSGVQSLASPLSNGIFFPSWFELEGQNITTDETLALVMDFYPSSTYQALTAAQSLGTITFTTLTASLLGVKESWLGDITATGFVGAVPMPPVFLLTWTLAGTTKSMNFILYASGMLLQ
jgi:hypothetical protein